MINIEITPGLAGSSLPRALTCRACGVVGTSHEQLYSGIPACIQMLYQARRDMDVVVRPVEPDGDGVSSMYAEPVGGDPAAA
ncbi:MAG: hypothetical protein U1E14_14900 [Geminicoccaceae bacterium]